MRANARNQAWIEAPPDIVWSFLANPWTYPDWVVGDAEVRSVDPEFPAPGSMFEHTQGLPKVGVKDTTSSVDCEPERCLELDARARPLLVTGVRWMLRGEGERRTHLTMLEWPKAGLVPALMPDLLFAAQLQLRNAESIRRLKNLAERRSG